MIDLDHFKNINDTYKIYKNTNAISILSGSGAGTFATTALLMIYYVVVVNVSLAVFNLIPVPPLDGSKIFGGLLPYKYIVEMICDWWSFSWNKNNLMEIFDFYNSHKNTMILHENTRAIVEEILSKSCEILSSMTNMATVILGNDENNARKGLCLP